MDLLDGCAQRSCEEEGICDLRFLSNRLGVLFFLSRVIFVVMVLDTFVFSGYDMMAAQTQTLFPILGEKT